MIKKLFLLTLFLCSITAGAFAADQTEPSNILYGNKNYVYAFTDGDSVVYIDQTSASLLNYSEVGMTFAVLEIKLTKKDDNQLSIMGQRVVNFFIPFNGNYTTAYIRDSESEDPIWKAFDISNTSKENEYARKPFLIGYELIMKKPYKYQ